MGPAGSRRGFTVIEALMASTVSVTIMGGILSLFLVFSRLYTAGTMQMDLVARTRLGVERIAAGATAAEIAAVQSGGDRLDVTIPATNLRAAIDAAASTIPVNSTIGFPSSGVAYIDAEAVRYGGRSGQNLTSCSRGYGGTSAAAHASNELVYLKLSYYLSGRSVYLDADGVRDTATDERLLWTVQKKSGVNLFQLVAKGSSTTARSDRVVITFDCYEDANGNNRRDAQEPALAMSLDLFSRNR